MPSDCTPNFQMIHEYEHTVYLKLFIHIIKMRVMNVSTQYINILFVCVYNEHKQSSAFWCF